MGGDSFYNFGEALLVVQHLRKLFDNLQKCDPTHIAYFTRYEAQYIQTKNIFSKLILTIYHLIYFNLECFFPSQLKHLGKVQFNELEMEGQSCDVVLQSFVSAERARTLLSNPHHLKRLAFEMTRARRQYMLFARSEWLEEGSDESRQLLDTFRSHGRIIGPNDVYKLKHHTQIYEMQAEILKMVREKGRRFAKELRKNSPEQYK